MSKEPITPIPGSANPKPYIPSGEEIFQMLMEDIEPELLVSLKLRKEEYADETDENRVLRFKKYAEAFAKYDKAATLYFEVLTNAVTEYCHNQLRKEERGSRNTEEQRLRNLENIFETES